MKTKMNKLRTVTLVVAIFTGTCLLSAPAKADTAAGEAAFKAKCAGCPRRRRQREGSHEDHGQGRRRCSEVKRRRSEQNHLRGKAPRGCLPYKTLTPEQGLKDLVSYIRIP